MLDKFLALLERFVVAHELIAANSGSKKTSVGELTVDVTTHGVETVKKELDKALKEVEKAKAKPEEDDLADDEPKLKPSDKLNRKPRATKPKAEPEPDLDKLREEIEVMSKHVGAGPSDEADHEMEDLMDEYGIRSVKKLKDLQVQEFHKELKAIVAKYYDIED